MSEPVVAFMISHKSREHVRVCENEGLVHVHACTGHLMLRPPQGSLEDALIAALDHGHDGVRLAAATALGDVGTARAVQALRALAQGASNHSHSQRLITLKAVADIQSRLQGAAPGQVSMSAEAGGEVSLAAEGGELSLARPGALRA